jgi:hypothetical protein
MAFDSHSFVTEVISGDQLIALDEFYSFLSVHRCDCELGQQSLFLLSDILTSDFTFLSGVSQRTILILSLLSKQPQIA